MFHRERWISRAEIDAVEGFSEAELDKLPYGAIHLDKDGKILGYNQAEAGLSGRRRENVLGKDFFTEVAPCTNVQEFAGKFREGVRKGSLHTFFPFVFDFERQHLHVWITLFYSRKTQTAWVFVNTDRPLDPSPM